jgi:hypothetical protein
MFNKKDFDAVSLSFWEENMSGGQELARLNAFSFHDSSYWNTSTSCLQSSNKNGTGTGTFHYLIINY